MFINPDIPEMNIAGKWINIRQPDFDFAPGVFHVVLFDQVLRDWRRQDDD